MRLRAVIFFYFAFWSNLFAQERSVPFTLEDRDRLIKLEQKIDAIDKRFEQIDKRFEQIDKRFEQIDKRFEELRSDVNARFEQQNNFFMIIVGLFTAITAITIGFALWDRRSMTRPFESKIKIIEEDIALLRKDNKNLFESLRELAKTDARLAEILKQFNIL
ncbi:MAG: hypothetical protein Fur0027_13020 [Raineya sp.]